MRLSKSLIGLIAIALSAGRGFCRFEWPLPIDELSERADIIAVVATGDESFDKSAPRDAPPLIGYPTPTELWVHYWVLKPIKALKGKSESVVVREVHDPGAGGCRLEYFRKLLPDRQDWFLTIVKEKGDTGYYSLLSAVNWQPPEMEPALLKAIERDRQARKSWSFLPRWLQR